MGFQQHKTGSLLYSSTQFQVSGVVAMELVMGCGNKAELKRTENFISVFTVAWPDAVDFAYAYSLLTQYRFTTGLSIPDCLIAAQTINQSAVLFSFNIKHFRVIQGLDVQQPYLR
ncbi:MAG: PIN domain-containing protein [Anaerolineae bacterium]|nr:PIN domain-containing protein [Anaerolineae bacterium]